MTDKERILARIDSAKHLIHVKRKIHDLRRAVIGDYGSLEDDAQPQMAPDEFNDREVSLEGLYRVLVRDFSAGLSNELQQAIRTLAFQTAWRAPSIEFEDVGPLEGALMSAYLKKVLGRHPYGCEAHAHMRRALLDYIVGGFGWVWPTMRGAGHVVQFVDSMDVLWDPAAEMIDDLDWQAVRVTRRLHQWIGEFGEGPFSAVTAGKDGTRHLDERVTLVYYFDVDGESGTYAVVREDGNAWRRGDEDVFVEAPMATPHYAEGDGYRMPMLALKPIVFLMLPSAVAPVSIAEGMLPHQITMRIEERYQQLIRLRGNPYWSSAKGALDDEQREVFERGQVGAVIEHKEGVPPPQVVPGMEAQQTSWQNWQRAKQSLTAMGGANPYASGNKVEGVSYAAEVNAIRESAGLMAAHIGLDHAAHWEKVATAVLNNARYDLAPRTIRIEGEELEFGLGARYGPIDAVIRPDADPIVSEDTMQYRSRDARREEAAANLQVAASMIQVAPLSVRKFYEKYLRAVGERDVAGHFEAPTQGMEPTPAAAMAETDTQ